VQIKEGKKFWEKSLNELIEPGIKLEKEVTSEHGRQTKIIAKIRVMKLENPENKITMDLLGLGKTSTKTHGKGIQKNQKKIRNILREFEE